MISTFNNRPISNMSRDEAMIDDEVTVTPVPVIELRDGDLEWLATGIVPVVYVDIADLAEQYPAP